LRVTRHHKLALKGYWRRKFTKGFAMSSDSQNTIKKIKNLLDQMVAINPLNHYYNLFCLGRLSENISKVRIAMLLFLKIKLHNGTE
jgi:hypothetical protein